MLSIRRLLDVTAQAQHRHRCSGERVTCSTHTSFRSTQSQVNAQSCHCEIQQIHFIQFALCLAAPSLSTVSERALYACDDIAQHTKAKSDFFFFTVLPAIKALPLPVCLLHATPCYVSKLPPLQLLMTSACAGCQIFCICATVGSKNVTQSKFFFVHYFF